MQHARLKEPARVAVYDFDNTSLDCSSTVRLVFYLLKSSYLSLGTSLKIGFWGLAYKLRLPQNESWVRGQLFKAFEGRPKSRVDLFLAKYYDEVLEKHFRPAAHASMHEFLDQGVDVLMVSASFEPLVQRAMQRHGFTGQVSTRMKVAPDGTYTREVDGLPVEGDEKIVAIERWCNEHYGEGQWKIVAAFGDHHSDEAMLACAEQSYAVNPNSLLEKIAKERGWTILDWDAKDAVVPAVAEEDSFPLTSGGKHAAAFADVEEFEPLPVEAWPEVEEIGLEEFPPEGVDVPFIQGEAAPLPEPSGTVTYATVSSTRDARGVAVSPKRPGMMADLSGKMPFVAAITGRMPKVEVEPEPEIEAELESEIEAEFEPVIAPQVEPEPEITIEPEPEPVIKPQAEPEPPFELESVSELEPESTPASEPEPVLVPEPEPQPEPEPAKKPRTTRKRTTKKKDSESEAEVTSESEPEKKPRATRKRTSKKATAFEPAPEAEPAPEPEPVKKRATRKRTTKKTEAVEPEPEAASEPEVEPASEKKRATRKRTTKKAEAPEPAPETEPTPEPEPEPAKKPRTTRKRTTKKKASEEEPSSEVSPEADSNNSAM